MNWSWRRLSINLIQLRNNKLQLNPFLSIKNKALKSLNILFSYRLTPVSFLVIVPLLLTIQPGKVLSNSGYCALDSLKTNQLWLAAQVLPGSGQVINKQYWKLPVVYSGIGSMLYFGSNANKSYIKYKDEYKQSLSLGNPNASEKLMMKYYEQRQIRNQFYAGATVFYLASVADALLVYNKEKHSPATATILSTIVPGLGQMYNGKYWKVPVVYGGLSTMYFMVDWNNRGYKRFKKALLYVTDDDPDTHSEFATMNSDGVLVEQRSEDELRLIQNSYRRYRDLTALGFVFTYVLNIIDANVDANLYDWDVSDDLSLRVEPNLNSINFGAVNNTEPVFGLSCKITF